MEQSHSLKNIYPRSIPCYYNVENRYYVTTKSTITSPTNGGNIRTSYKEDTRMSHIQPERLPKSKMASSTIDLRSKSCMFCVLETSLTRNFAADISWFIFKTKVQNARPLTPSLNLLLPRSAVDVIYIVSLYKHLEICPLHLTRWRLTLSVLATAVPQST